MSSEFGKNPSFSVAVPFEADRVAGSWGEPSLEDDVTADDVSRIIDGIESVARYFKNETILGGVLATVEYKRVTPKSRRIQSVLCQIKDSFSSTVGSRFELIGKTEAQGKKHVVTHFVSAEELEASLSILHKVKRCLEHFPNRTIGQADIKLLGKAPFSLFGSITKGLFSKTVADVSIINRIYVHLPSTSASKDTLVTLFSCFSENGELRRSLAEMGIDVKEVLDSQSLILSAEQFGRLLQRAPYLIAMSCDDFTQYMLEERAAEPNESFGRRLPPPDGAPVIGCFDTMYEKGSYLDPYVTFENLTTDEYLRNPANCIHGTKIDSLLVEGNRLNPDLEDGCGFFRVLHFGVGGSSQIDFAALVMKMEECVSKHCNNVKVWNISLGDAHGADPNFISLLGAKIDYLSRKYRVLFVVAGTNLDTKHQDKRIGSPADSLNAIVVNSVVYPTGKLADYTRRGPVLWSMVKPDICYYGGDQEHQITCYGSDGHHSGYGTSIAAPLIARKAAFLIYKCGFSVECAKALIIDSAVKWENRLPMAQRCEFGYGIPPIHIEDILKSNRDEIRFIIAGRVKEQYTLIHDFPVLLDGNRQFGFGAKLVFCYYTQGERRQGVDYPCQDVSIDFGRSDRVLDERDKRFHYKIVDSVAPRSRYSKEETMVFDLNKWNNTKVLMEGPKKRKQNKDYSTVDPLWGIRITFIDRFGWVSEDAWKDKEKAPSIPFGVVLTFKTTDGSDADYEAFIRRIRANENYYVTKVDVGLSEKIQNSAKETISFKNKE